MNKSATVERYKGKWLPGVSGNPAGRPRVPVRVRELAKLYAEESIERLVGFSRENGYSDKIEFLSTVAILNLCGNANLLNHFMKSSGMSAWEYLNTPMGLLPKKNAELVGL